MKHLFGIILIATIFQATILGQAADFDEQTRKINIYLHPAPVFDYTPRYRFGMELHNPSRLAFALDAGYGESAINGWTEIGFIGNEYQLAEIRPEVKWYLTRYDFPVKWYVSSELFFIYMTDVMYDDYFHTEDDYNQITEFDRAVMEKMKGGLHLKFGVKRYLDSGVTLDIFGGIGVALRNISYYQVENPNTYYDYSIWYEWFVPVYKFPGTSMIPHITMGFKLGYFWER